MNDREFPRPLRWYRFWAHLIATLGAVEAVVILYPSYGLRVLVVLPVWAWVAVLIEGVTKEER